MDEIFGGFEGGGGGVWEKNEINVLFQQGAGGGGLLRWYYSRMSILLHNPRDSRFMDRIS